MQDGVNKQLLEKINRVEMNFQMVVDWYGSLKTNQAGELDRAMIDDSFASIQYEIDKFKARIRQHETTYQDKKD